jgi:hypothetical protein
MPKQQKAVKEVKKPIPRGRPYITKHPETSREDKEFVRRMGDSRMKGRK